MEDCLISYPRFQPHSDDVNVYFVRGRQRKKGDRVQRDGLASLAVCDCFVPELELIKANVSMPPTVTTVVVVTALWSPDPNLGCPNEHQFPSRLFNLLIKCSLSN